IKEDKTHHNIFVGAHRDGEVAINLYKNFGFEFNGQIFGHEHVMVLTY
ncbi:spermidine acetyltransferase, partial [Bacteroides xylanisolvens]